MLATAANAFYLPGVAPIEYKQGDDVEMKVNKLTSVKTQLPFAYYTLPFCQPTVIVDSVENLGEILEGDKIENSPYQIRMLVNESCKKLCTVALDKASKAKFKLMVHDEYVVNWIIDNLPAATHYVRRGLERQDATFISGFPVGVEHAGKFYIHNHVKLHISYFANPHDTGYSVVGFEVEPYSKTHAVRGGAVLCEEEAVFPYFDLMQNNEIIYTYDVVWTESSVRWASRYDSYLKMTAGGQIHWFSILNSLLIVCFLSGMIAVILLRTLRKDIAMYNDFTSQEQLEESGWKLVHGDVFRKPLHARWLAVSVGSGVQILGMSLVTLVFALLGVLSPVNRGALLQSMMLLFTFMGSAAGYVSSRLYKVFQGTDWKQTSLLTAFFYPGLFFTIFFILNLFIWGQKSSGAVPFATMFAMLALWFGISVPLVFLGAYFGFRKETIELPVRVNHIPRQIPDQPWVLNPYFTMLLSGTLPFGAVYTELFFIMSSIWQHQYYYLFGFLGLVLLILIITCAEISILLTYFYLTSEDYRWWWRAFFSTGTCGFYVFAYSIVYFQSRLSIEKLVSSMLYFGYMALISTIVFLLAGSIGLLSSFSFARIIYSSIKID